MLNLTKLFFIFLLSIMHIQYVFSDGMPVEDEMNVEDGKASLVINDADNSSNDTQVVIEQTNNTTLKDPFKRGITRSPAYATFGSGDDNMQYRLDDLRHLTDLHHYRVVSIIQRDEAPRTKILKLFEQDFYGDEHEAFYVRLKSSLILEEMLVAAKTLEISYSQNLNRNIVIRNLNQKNTSSFALEYGPFSTIEMAVVNCYYVTAAVKGKQLDCGKSIHKHFVSDKENNKNKSIATLGLSQFALLALKAKPFDFDLNVLSKTTIEIMEDEPLGPNGFYITNINEMGVSVAGLNGDVLLIPVSTFPISNFSKTSPSSVKREITSSSSN
jgi:hypothetical protein